MVLGAVKVCKVSRGKVVCKSVKPSTRRRRRLGSMVLGSMVLGKMPRRDSKGRFVKSRR
jgi:hypothetical protein